MWKNVGSALAAQLKTTPLLSATNALQQQIRTTFVLKRKFATPLHKKGREPKTLRTKYYIYELVKDTNIEKYPKIDLILTEYVEGLGNVGDKISVKPMYGYKHLLLPGLAVYANKENIEKYHSEEMNSKDRYSSAISLLTVKSLSRIVVSVVMNKENPWTLKPWHVKTSFRKCGYIVPEDAITLPETPISGPDMDNEGKEFFVTVTINNKEQVNVRCILHHWSTFIADRIPYVYKFWEQEPKVLLPEQADTLETMPKKPPVMMFRKKDVRIRKQT